MKHAKDFIKHLEVCEKAPNTCAAYKQAIEIYFSDYDVLSKENMINFKQNEMKNHKPSTANLRIIAMNRYCDFIGKSDCKVKRVKIYGNTTVENVPTKEEYDYLLSCFKIDNHMKMYWMLRFITSTGARASELVRLEKKDLVNGYAQMLTKGKVRRILIPTALISESKEYFESIDSKYLFPNKYGYMMQPQSISKMLAKYGKKYGVRSEVLHPHAFRHLFAMLFLNKTGNLTLLSNLLGHESVRTTAIYLQMSGAQQREELDKAVCW